VEEWTSFSIPGRPKAITSNILYKSLLYNKVIYNITLLALIIVTKLIFYFSYSNLDLDPMGSKSYPNTSLLYTKFDSNFSVILTLVIFQKPFFSLEIVTDIDLHLRGFNRNRSFHKIAIYEI
jgi:hypothetical protein